MSLQSTRPLTAAELDARRQNAQKSSGPRTPEGKRFSRRNATRHGHYAAHYSEAFRETLLVLKEDPDEFERLRQRLLASFPALEESDAPQPLLPILALAVEELAQLHWELDRERRCQNRLRQRRLGALDEILDQRQAEISSDKYEEKFDRPAHQPGGLESAPPSANRFKAILYHLASMIGQVDGSEFQEYHRDMWLIYDDGGEMSDVGLQILNLFRRLSGKYKGIMPPPEENSPAELRALLVQQREKYARQYEDFKPLWPVIPEYDRERARNLEWLEDNDRDFLEESREREEWLRRAIDRKLRTIVALGREVRLEAAQESRMTEVGAGHESRGREGHAAGNAHQSPPSTGGTRESRRREARESQSREAHPTGRASDESARSGSTAIASPHSAQALAVGDAGGTPVVHVGHTGGTPVPRRHAASKSKNEGTNRGARLESTNALPPAPLAERAVRSAEEEREE